MACNSLRLRESDTALVGAINLIINDRATAALAEASLLSPTSECKSFDASADGYVRGEGCGVLVIKRLEDARKDNNRILAIIRGSAVNQNGQSLNAGAPNGDAQVKVITTALLNANVLPSEVSYVEAHGTGTVLGYATEIDSLQSVYCIDRNHNEPLIVGSLKPNIGHLEVAAGMSEIIKVILMMQHREIPPLVSIRKINPYINFENGMVLFPDKTIKWHPTNNKLIAGVNAFGISGSNAHIILEEPDLPSKQPVIEKICSQILCLSATNEAGLMSIVKKYSDFIAVNQNIDFASMCYTNNIGKASFKKRICFIASDITELKEKFDQYANHQHLVIQTDSLILSTRLESWVQFYKTQLQFKDKLLNNIQCKLSNNNLDEDYFFDGDSFSTNNMAEVEILEICKDTIIDMLQDWGIKDVNIKLTEGHESKENHIWDSILLLISQKFVDGIEIDWDKFYTGCKRNVVTVPTYPFLAQKFWIDRIE
jgi:acyl transferase domain-containing protein